MPAYGHRRLQLAGMDYEEIPGTGAGVFVLRAMKAERLDALLGDAVWEEDLLVQVPPELFGMVLRYILGREIDRGAFETRLNRIVNPQIRSKAMTLDQVYRQEGRQEGLQKGLQKGRQEDILEALNLRFGSIPGAVEDAVFAVEDEEKLRALLRGAIQSVSIGEFARLLEV